MITQPLRYALRKHIVDDLRVQFTGKVSWRGGTVANVFDDSILAHMGNRGCVPPICKCVKNQPSLSKPAMQ